ncbi:hypothetical protein SAMN05216464_10645 [Mucilaginibacter pineti]|uniref:Transmembrane protein n=1 Tax=Mucilaginibacter pineti TaxID=1391627 RepID=A0A1G7CPQ7_9SPHI|nr:hypothetical protein SAMN05216464_10645 [Mucilaginibacter pineti]
MADLNQFFNKVVQIKRCYQFAILISFQSHFITIQILNLLFNKFV